MDLDYSDGAEIEPRIESLLTEATDLSSLTCIAHEHYHEWPIRYHLCPERANLLRHLNFSNLNILELGAGMGAISRLLAEKAHSLTVVEGTKQRFQALSERLRDLSNWSGQVSNLMDVSFAGPFDAVIVVGALEYSELYVKKTLPEETPFDAFLRKAKSFLKPNGVLILAIENQLGLKYFNGAPEDHTSHPFDGISGYSLDKTPKTFSRKKFLRLFETAGFNSFQEYYPFPDYKVPTCVITPELSSREPDLAANLACHTSELDAEQSWNSLLVTHTIAEAGLLPEMANSFLLIACQDPNSTILQSVLPPKGQLAWHYSLNRKAPTCTIFSEDQKNIKSEKFCLKEPLNSTIVHWTPAPVEPIKRGTNVRERLLRLGYFNGYKAWYLAFSQYISWAIDYFKTAPGLLDRKALDAIYTNAVESTLSQSFEVFDLEWSYHKEIPVSWFVLRNLLALYKDTPSLPMFQNEETLETLYNKLCKELSITPSLAQDVELEAQLQVEITPEKMKYQFVQALNARIKKSLKLTVKRQSASEVALYRMRSTNLLNSFPDFLSSMDRPTTRFFLNLDRKIRNSDLLRRIYDWGLKMGKQSYRLLPTRYEVENIDKEKKGTPLAKLKKTFGAFPKTGWNLIDIKTSEECRLDSCNLQFTIQGSAFRLSIPKISPGHYQRICRLHEPAQELTLLLEPPHLSNISRVTSRNLLKPEVVLRTVLPQLRKTFKWKKELKCAFAFWNQGKFRGLVAYVHTLVQKGDLGIVESYSDWAQKYDVLSEKDRTQIINHLKCFDYKPTISLLMPVYNTDPQWLNQAINSVKAQLYPLWELCIIDDASTNPATLSFLSSLNKQDTKTKIFRRNENGHISAASNSALQLATGEFVAILDHDDEISETALYHVVRELNQNRTLELLYSDEDKIDTRNRRFLPHFKTDWNPELFYCYNLITHFAVIKTTLVKAVGGFRTGFEGSQDYDLFLRCIEQLNPNQIQHIPFVLYHWRVIESSTSGHSTAKPYAKTAALKALNEHLLRKNIKASIEEGFNDCFRIRYVLPEKLPMVSIIICTRDRVDLLRTIVKGIQEETDYSNIEILIVNNQSREKKTLRYFSELKENKRVRIIDFDQEFNFAAMNNLAARYAQGEVLAFLNNDLKVKKADWLKEMVSFAIQPHIGAVGAKLFYPSGRLQHAGVILGIGGIAGHSHKGLGLHQNDFYARTHVSQCVSAVTAACMVVKKTLFDLVKGFDEKHLTVAFNDVDLCLKIREAGLSNVWTPYAELFHFESESRGSDQRPETFPRFQKEAAFMKEKWGELLTNDPYYNPNLTLQRENFDYAYPPRVYKPWKTPLNSSRELLSNS